MKSWEKFKTVVEKSFPEFVGALNPGATKNELIEFENSINVTLPEEFIDLYTFSNGQNDTVNAYLFGMEFLTLNRVKKAYDVEIDVMEALAGEGDMCSSYPENHIKCAYCNPKWIPIFSGGGGSYIGIDLDPDINGKIGQTINFGTDDEDKIVLADSLDKFIKLCTEKLEKGDFIKYKNEDRAYYYRNLYFADALYQEIRNPDQQIASNYTYYSIWVTTMDTSKLPDDYFKNQFKSDFKISPEVKFDYSGASCENKSKASIEYLLKFQMHSDKYLNPVKNRLSQLGIEEITYVFIAEDFNYEATNTGIEKSNDFIFAGSYLIE